jgi:tRNA nucleotidyltransferase (CCA-adding enzyme)
MTSTLEELLARVTRKVTPKPEQRRRVLALACSLKRKMETALRAAELTAEVRVEGSTAKDTWLGTAPEVDIFLQVPTKMARASLGAEYLTVAKKVMKEANPTERFAEHPYLEARLEGVRINIVPCYRVRRGEWKSATDRTPFHTNYVKPLLTKELRTNVRLLKQFMTGIGVYGAEIKTGGFSGYLCELLTIFYGSFQQVVEGASNWKPPTYIDIEGHYREAQPELETAFSEPLIVVDPVDPKRNVASAVRADRLNEFIAAVRALLNTPSLDFFYPPQTAPLEPEALLSRMRGRGTSFVMVVFGKIDTVPDVLWGQLLKTQRAIHRLVTKHDFKVARDTVWSDEDTLSLLLLEIEHRFLPRAAKHWGPPLTKRPACLRFLRKHSGSPRVLSGPRIEKGRWVVETARQYTDIMGLLANELKDGGRQVGVAGLVSQALLAKLRILADEEIVSTYAQNRGVAQFLGTYLEGKPQWLEAAYIRPAAGKDVKS